MTFVSPVASSGSGIAAVTARINTIKAQFGSPTTFRAVLEAASTAPTSQAAGATSGSTSVAFAPTPTGAPTALAALLGGPAATRATDAAGNGAGPAKSVQDQVVSRARDFLGVPYVWGGEQQNGVDCSGLMLQVFKSVGVDLPRIADDQSSAGRPVSRENLQPGDMVFFNYDSDAQKDHVGLYIGDGKMIHAPKPGDVVKVSDVDWGAFTNARRVLPDAAESVAAVSAGAAGGSGRTGGLDAAQLPESARPWVDDIERAAAAQGVEPALLAALVWSESGFDAQARSSAGAIGLGQLMPATAAGLGVNPYQPADNLKGAATYLAQQLDRFGDPKLALAAYNAGPGAVNKYGGVPPYAETTAYVEKVMDRYSQLGGRR